MSVSLVDGHIDSDAPRMTDNEIIKAETLTSGKINKSKIKAIYPHITVSGNIDKPYYNIDWYDIEKQTMYSGLSSYKLPLVYKWLQEEFEVVEADIDDLINRQKAEIERLNKELEETQEKLEILLCEATGGLLSKHTYTVNTMTTYAHDYVLKCCDEAEAEAIKEFAERLKEKERPVFPLAMVIDVCEIDNLVKEMVGDTE